MLVSNPDHRITLAEVFNHPWLNEDHQLPFQPAPYPNRTTQSEIDEEIIDHMVNMLKVDSPSAIKHDLIMNKATSNFAIYHLLAGRLARYRREYKETAPQHRKRTGSMKKKKVSKDHGYFGEDDDAASVATVHGRLVSRGGKKVSQ